MSGRRSGSSDQCIRTGAAPSDPFAAPANRPNFLDSPADCDAVVEGARIARRIVEASPMNPYRGPEFQPGAEAKARDELLDYARGAGTTVYHPVGTCKMGSDPMAVVEERLRVRGLDRLRVADASIMPVLVSGNTNAPVIMIGSRRRRRTSSAGTRAPPEHRTAAAWLQGIRLTVPHPSAPAPFPLPRRPGKYPACSSRSPCRAGAHDGESSAASGNEACCHSEKSIGCHRLGSDSGSRAGRGRHLRRPPLR